MTTLITGATGFLGRHLTSVELLEGHEVIGIGRRDNFVEGCTGIVCSLKDIDTLRDALTGISPQHVYHLAAMTIEPSTPEELSELFRVNVQYTVTLINLLKEWEFKGKLVLASSCSVYGQPQSEDGIVAESEKLKPVLQYGLSKLMQEQLLSYSAAREGFEFCAGRLFNLMGPGEPPRLITSALCRRAANMLSKGDKDPLEVGNTSSVRDFLDVRDAATALQAIMDSQIIGECNVCSGTPRVILELVESICQLSGIDGFVESGALKNPVDIKAVFGDNSRLRSSGWVQKYNFRESLELVWNEALKDSGLKSQ